MKKIDFTQNGGFPLDQNVLNRMQTAYMESLEAFVRFLGCQPTGSYVIYGCSISGANITEGMLYIDGDMCPFAGATGTLATKIAKQTTTQNLPFENGTNPPVLIEHTAVVNSNGTALQDFTRFNYINDPNYIAFTAAMLTKFNGIEAGAQVNVQPDWNVSNPSSMQFIKNKPNLFTILHKGESLLGDIGSDDEIKTILFPNIGTTNYMVLFSIESMSQAQNQGGFFLPGWNWDNDISVVIVNKQATSFQMGFREYSAVLQNIKVTYMIVPV